jgi:hypothetical protein
MIEIPLMATFYCFLIYSIIHRPAGSAGKTVQNFPSFLPFHSISKRGSDPEAEMLQNLTWEKA